RDAPRTRRRLRRSLQPTGSRGRARGDLMADIHGEEGFGEAYDGRLLGRLWPFVRPYRAAFWAAVLLSPVQQLFGLVQPYLLKLGIDRYIQPGDADGLRVLGLIFVAAIVGEFAASYAQSYTTMIVAQRSL